MTLSMAELQKNRGEESVSRMMNATKMACPRRSETRAVSGAGKVTVYACLWSNQKIAEGQTLESRWSMRLRRLRLGSGHYFGWDAWYGS